MEDKKLYWNIKDLRNWDKNPRVINKIDFERGKRQLQRCKEITGEWLFDPLVITPKGEVLGGNMRLRALRDLGVKDIWVNIVNTKTEAERLELAIAANDRWGSYVEQDLAELITDHGADINLSDYRVDLGTPISLKDLVDRFGPDSEEDEVPGVQEGESISKLGEVYQLGRHRLMCGDAIDEDSVEKLMDGKKADMVFTDPPYNVTYEGKTKDKLTIENDTQSPEEFHNFLYLAFSLLNENSKIGANIYICHSDMERVNFTDAFIEAGWKLAQVIIWVKDSFVMGRQDYQWQHEPLLYGWKEGVGHYYNGGYSQTTVWNIDRPRASKEHPTMKPLGLIEKALRNSSREKDIILDTFGGSGSTLIACEQINRICYMMELDPRYCDVIRKRHSRLTDQEKNWQELTPVV